MKKITKIMLLISLLFIPSLVFASNGSNQDYIMPIFFEIFGTIHMSAFVLTPLSKMIKPDDSSKIFWIMFIARIVLLVLLDIFVTPWVGIVDFISIFIGAFIVVPICSKITNTPIDTRSNQVIKNTTAEIKGIEIRCAKCNSILKITDKFCAKCGEPFDGNNVVVSENKDSVIENPPKDRMMPSNFDSIYSLTEDKMLETFIKKELIKAGIDESTKLIPSDVLKRRKVLNVIFSILIFVYITLIFFHFPLYTYIIGIIIILIFFYITRKYNIIKYLKKQLKERPTEKISNIVMSAKNSFVIDDSKILFISSMLTSVILPLIIFWSPRILYEKVDGGYAVRYYIFGMSNFKTATIPETYKNEKVVSLRGNTFSNMPYLESVKLPDTIIEIRGQAFKNCKRLTHVNIPKRLEYLGGGAFYNATSITSIELPDTLTYLGGESFYGATSLEYIKLSSNLTEIRGNSFEYCTSLKSIVIPDNITRIGGHAFYGDTALSEVLISENSKLSEIGSSAFRMCPKLYNIFIPANTSVNERAFKESPTVIQRYRWQLKTDDLEDSYTLYLKEKRYINNELSVKLTSFDDLYHDKSYFIGLSGTIEIELNKELYYFNFQTSTPQNYKYFIDKYSFEISGGFDNYVEVRISTR